MITRFFNVHSHRKPGMAGEFVCRNAFHFLSAASIAKLSYAVSVGVHPWHAAQFSEEVLQRLRQCGRLPQVLAIGETGIDRRKGPPLEIQMLSWEAHFRLAQEMQLPLLLHCVRAWQDVLPLVSKTEVPLLLHDFRGNEEVLKSFLGMPKVFFSFGKSLMLSSDAQRIVKLVPEERLLLETDNSAFTIEEIYLKAAGIIGKSPNEIGAQLKKNALAFFGAKALAFF
jgi:TatD DNase family protein